MPRPQKIDTPRAARLHRAMEHYERVNATKLSKQKLAEMIGTTGSRITDFQNGASLSKLREAAAVLGVSPEWLEHGENPPDWMTPPPRDTTPLRSVTLVGAVTAGDGYVRSDSGLREMVWKDSWKLMLVEGTSAYPVIYPNQFAIVDTAREIHHNNIVVIEVDNSDEYSRDPSKPRVRAYLKRYCKAEGAPNGYLLASINSGRDTPYIPDHKILAKVPVVGVLFESADKTPSDDETVEVL